MKLRERALRALAYNSSNSYVAQYAERFDMRISYEWLKSLVDIPQDPHELEKEYIRTGTEVEAIDTIGADISGVVTARVLEKTPHPDSDHMFVCKMDVGNYHTDEAGNPTPLQVVCGAQNFNAGDITATALVGAELPGGIHIKKGKLRGIDSCGMNCSLSELGLEKESDGIVILPPTTPVGVDFCEWKGLTDTVVDCEITPNRPDCLSMIGCAIETSAIFDKDTHIELPHVEQESAEKTSDLVAVDIKDEGICTRYTARVLKHVVIKPSPDWMQKRLIAAGTRPINNVVDITNYVMYLTGQPLHAFDYNKLARASDGKTHIAIRRAHEGETLVTLDDAERTLTNDMVVICDSNDTSVCLAGVMGGKNSEIDDATTDVLLESACFNAGHTSRTSRNLDLMSEASIRYERQVDPNGCVRASEIACALFERYAEASVSKDVLDVYPEPVALQKIVLRPGRVCALAGAQIPVSFMISRLERLGCECAGGATDSELIVTVPSVRVDLTREIDLVEEIVRLWGEGDITATLPAARNHAGGLSETQKCVRTIHRFLRAQGLSETTTYHFASPEDLSDLGMPAEGKGLPVEILRPLVSEQSQMRQDILPGLLRACAYNNAHGVQNVSLYEIGRVFYGHKNQTQPAEPSYIACVLSGAWDDERWCKKPARFDFFDAKGIVEALAEELHIKKLRFRELDADAAPWLQPGAAAQVLIGGEELGWIGLIHPTRARKFACAQPVVAFELSQAVLLRHVDLSRHYEEVPTLPGVSIDLALVVDEDLSYESLMQRLHSAGGKLLCDVRLFDIYRDPVRVGAGKKSMAFSLTYRSSDHTLTQEEVQKAHAKLIAKVSKSCNAEVRSA